MRYESTRLLTDYPKTLQGAGNCWDGRLSASCKPALVMRREIIAVKVVVCENVSVALYTLGDVDRKISESPTLLGGLNFG